METVSGPVEPGVAERAGKAFEGFTVAGVPGAVCDPQTEIGGLCTGIGIGTNEIYDEVGDQLPFSTGASLGVRRIGIYDDAVAIRAANTPPPGFVSLCQAASDVAPGGVLGTRTVNGNDLINETGRTVKTGQYAFGVDKGAVVAEQKTVKSSKK